MYGKKGDDPVSKLFLSLWEISCLMFMKTRLTIFWKNIFLSSELKTVSSFYTKFKVCVCVCFFFQCNHKSKDVVYNPLFWYLSQFSFFKPRTSRYSSRNNVVNLEEV